MKGGASVIRSRRKELRLTQADLGNLCGVSKTTVVNWEQGINKPKGEHLIALSKSLKVDSEAILTGNLGVHENPIVDVGQAVFVPIDSNRVLLLKAMAEALDSSAVKSLMQERESAYSLRELELLEDLLVRSLEDAKSNGRWPQIN